MVNQQANGNHKLSKVIKLLPLIAFLVPLAIFYYIEPHSFEATWKGRTYHLFFIWLILLETILGWEKLQPQTLKLQSLKSIARNMLFAVATMLPTAYVVSANYFGLNSFILRFSAESKIPLQNLMPLSFEYLVFAMLLVVIVLLGFGLRRLQIFSISTFFAGIIGAIYVIDNLYPYGRFTPFQIIVPTTTMLAANVLSAMGYTTTLAVVTSTTYGSMPYLQIVDAVGRRTAFAIAWPCSGVESLLVYSVVVLLFLKNSTLPLAHKVVYFTIGAAITYFINVLRIVTIFLISINTGGGLTPQTQRFHDYYGQLYSIAWIVSYPLLIIAIQALIRKVRQRKS
ncbi:MAG: exosortase/archaeosortase family protein [Candidatus Bathyarchaeia archaeon]